MKKLLSLSDWNFFHFVSHQFNINLNRTIRTRNPKSGSFAQKKSKRRITLEALEDRFLLANDLGYDLTCENIQNNFENVTTFYSSDHLFPCSSDIFQNPGFTDSDHSVANFANENIITDENCLSNGIAIEFGLNETLDKTDQVDQAGNSGEVIKPRQTQETPSMTVTTDQDVVDPYDHLISLREAISVYSGDGIDGTVNYGIYSYGQVGQPDYVLVNFAPEMLGATIVLNEEIEISKVLDIDATALDEATGTEVQPRNVTISGNNSKRIFSVTGGTSSRAVNLIALNLIRGNGTGSRYNNYGGAILNTGYLLVKNCDLYTNNATKNGGAIANKLSLTLDDTDCYTNTALYGGAIFNSGTTTIQPTCNFHNNTATKNGGAISNISTLTLDSGGSVTGGTLGVLNITNANIYNNISTSGFGGGIGNWGTAVLVSVDLYGNSAGENGGAITNGPAFILSQVNNDQTLFNSLPTSSMSITTSTIGGTSSTYANSAQYGGGIINSTTLEIYGSTIAYNAASVNGGGVSNTTNGVLTLGNSGTTQTTFSNNQANNGFAGGLLNVQSATLAVTSGSTVTLSNNSDSTSIGTGTGDGNYANFNSDLTIGYTYNSNTKTGVITPESSALSLWNSLSYNFGMLNEIELQKGMTMTLPNSSSNLLYLFDSDKDGNNDFQTTSILSESDIGLKVGKHQVWLTIKNEQGNTFGPIEITISIYEEPFVGSFQKEDLTSSFVRLKLLFDCNIFKNNPLYLHWGDGSVTPLQEFPGKNHFIHYYGRSGNYPISIQTTTQQIFYLTSQNNPNQKNYSIQNLENSSLLESVLTQESQLIENVTDFQSNVAKNVIPVINHTNERLTVFNEKEDWLTDHSFEIATFSDVTNDFWNISDICPILLNATPTRKNLFPVWRQIPNNLEQNDLTDHYFNDYLNDNA